MNISYYRPYPPYGFYGFYGFERSFAINEVFHASLGLRWCEVVLYILPGNYIWWELTKSKERELSKRASMQVWHNWRRQWAEIEQLSWSPPKIGGRELAIKLGGWELATPPTSQKTPPAVEYQGKPSHHCSLKVKVVVGGGGGTKYKVLSGQTLSG